MYRHTFAAKIRSGKKDAFRKVLGKITIWSDGTYIFGYDEIDTTMEKDPTEEDLEGTRAWELRQLEIMDWITNDVDWLTQTVHAQVKRLAWHQGSE